MNGSDSTQPTTATWGVHEWSNVLHNVVHAPGYTDPSHPNYATLQEYRDQALSALGQIAQAGAKKDLQEAGQLVPPGHTIPLPFGIPRKMELGSALAGTVGFGRGASLGLTGPNSPIGFMRADPQASAAISAAHPTATTVGDIAGTTALGTIASPLVAGMSPALGAATLGGVMGGARGAIDPQFTGDRAIDGVLYGLGGAIGGAAIGKITQRLVTPVANNIMRIMAARGIAADEAEDATTQLMRAWLTKNTKPGTTPEQIEETLQQWKQKIVKPPVRALPLAAGHTVAPRPDLNLQEPPRLSIPRGEDLRAAREQMAPIAGTEGKGFEVTGTRATPPVPTSPTLLEMQQGVTQQGMARAASETPSPTNPGAVLRSLEARKGSPLTDEERDRVLTNLLGKKGSRPGHPIWYGGGTFTP